MNHLSLSVIIPVLGEQKNINTCISSLRDIFGEQCEIIVADGSADGSTIECIEDPEVKSIISTPGRAIQMNAAAAVATKKILLFLHADTTLPANAPEVILESSKLPWFTAGAFNLAFDDQHPLLRLTAFVGNIRSRIERIPYGDQAPFVKADYFHSSAGFPEIPIMEDVEFFSRIRKKRLLIIISRESVRTSSRRYRKTGVIKCFLRNWLLRLLYLAGTPPTILAEMYKPNRDN
jgi:rSAM/selenodomain-associated transferase 2